MNKRDDGVNGVGDDGGGGGGGGNICVHQEYLIKVSKI